MQMGWYDRKVCRVRDLSCGDTRIFLELEVRRLDCRSCGKVKRERLDFLADNPHYTKRFANYVGRRCRAATIKDVAVDLKLDWHTVKTLDQQYLEAQLARAGTPSPQVIGIDEIAIRKGHTYRIVVSDLLRGRPIWFGGKDRSELPGAARIGRRQTATLVRSTYFNQSTLSTKQEASSRGFKPVIITCLRTVSSSVLRSMRRFQVFKISQAFPLAAPQTLRRRRSAR
jgi:hypothetical protein